MVAAQTVTITTGSQIVGGDGDINCIAAVHVRGALNFIFHFYFAACDPPHETRRPLTGDASMNVSFYVAFGCLLHRQDRFDQQ